MITVGKVDIDFRMKDQLFARQLYGGWDSFCLHSVEKVINDTLSPFDTDDKLIEIEELVVSLPPIVEEEFYDRFPLLFAQKLNEQFTGLLRQADDNPQHNHIKVSSSDIGKMEALIFFLNYGYMPADIPNEFRHPVTLLNTLMQTGKIIWKSHFLREWGRSSFRVRMVRQFKDSELESFVSYTHKAEAPLIHEFTRVAINSQPFSESHNLPQTAFREVVWVFVLSYLMKDNLGLFNRRQFVVYTIRELAAHYNLDYILVLNAILQYAQQRNEKGKSTELIILLRTLYEEEDISRKVTSHAAKKRGKSIEDKSSPSPSVDKEMSGTEARSEARSEAGRVKQEKPDGSIGLPPLSEKMGAIPFASRQAQMKNESSFRSRKGANGKPIAAGERNGLVADKPMYNERTVQNGFEIEKDIIKVGQKIEVCNAGIALLSPFLPKLFTIIGFMDNGQFISEEKQIRAVFILQQLVYGRSDDFEEYDLFLNKLLVGLALDLPLPRGMELSDNEKEACTLLVESAKNNWTKMQHTNAETFISAFVKRLGILEKKESSWELVVEERAYDMLLDSLPWSFSVIKYHWMENPIYVKWRNQ